MANVSEQHNVGADLRGQPIMTSTQTTTFSSNGAPNATEVAGAILDRLALGRHYLSMKVLVPFQVSTLNATSTATALASVTTRVLHGTSTAPATALGSTGVTTTIRGIGTTATSTSFSAVHVQDVDLRTARRYIQVYVTPTLVSSSSGWFSYNAVAAMSGPDQAPAVVASTPIWTSS